MSWWFGLYHYLAFVTQCQTVTRKTCPPTPLLDSLESFHVYSQTSCLSLDWWYHNHALGTWYVLVSFGLTSVHCFQMQSILYKLFTIPNHISSKLSKSISLLVHMHCGPYILYYWSTWNDIWSACSWASDSL